MSHYQAPYKNKWVDANPPPTKNAKGFYESPKPGPSIVHDSIWSPTQMVSMNDLQALSDDGFDDLFAYSPKAGPASPEIVAPKMTASSSVHIGSPDRAYMHYDENKLTAVTNNSFNQTKQGVMREIIWKQNQLISFDDLMDDSFNDMTEFIDEMEPTSKPQDEPQPVAKPTSFDYQIRKDHLPVAENEPQIKDFDEKDQKKSVPDKTALLCELKKIQQDFTFRKIDAFLDKYNTMAPRYNAQAGNYLKDIQDQMFLEENVQPQPAQMTQLDTETLPLGRPIQPPMIQMENRPVETQQMETREISNCDLVLNHNQNQKSQDKFQEEHEKFQVQESLYLNMDEYKTQKIQDHEPIKQHKSMSQSECDISETHSNVDFSEMAEGDNKEDYIARRKVNNEAAQRSRSKRRKMLDAKMKRIVMYEQENPKLKSKLETHLSELLRLKSMLAFYEKYSKDSRFTNKANTPNRKR